MEFSSCVLLLLLFESIFAQENACRTEILGKNPELKERFSTSLLTKVCRRNATWSQRSSLRPDTPKMMLSRKQTEWLKDVLNCKDLSCICKLGSCRSKRQSTSPVNKAIRKEYRMLSLEERAAFNKALNAVKNDLVDGKSKYDILIIYHTPEQSPGAHFGPAFLPYHRELMKMLEIVLRAQDISVGLPYWDNSLDAPLPDPTHSVLWTEELLGNGNGVLINGPFEGFRTHPDGQRIMRNIGEIPGGALFQEYDLAAFDEFVKFEELTWCVNPHFELVHGAAHIWIGGHMAGDLKDSPNDPLFFLLHAYVDYLWENWRIRKQSTTERENDYPTDDRSCTASHFGTTRMAPFNITNLEGLSNKYTDEFYNYQPSPTCTKSSPDCGSEYLFCDTRPTKARCLSKVRLGGNCNGFENTNICYHGQCSGGVCVKTEETTTTSEPPNPSSCSDNDQCCPVWSTLSDCNTKKWLRTNCKKMCGFCKSDCVCIDYKSQCEDWASRDECDKNPNYMLVYCRASCNVCKGPSDELVSQCRGKLKPWEICKNYDTQCPNWAARGECQKNSWWMRKNCPLACGVCK